MAPGDWKFSFKEGLAMSPSELELYQRKLLELRKKYKERVSQLSNCSFIAADDSLLPPADNIFATFLCGCKRHTPQCAGWFLLWDPSAPASRAKARSSLHNHCATWQFKSVSKEIQCELLAAFADYFEMSDDDDTHPYSLDSAYSLQYGFKAGEEEFPDYVTASLKSEDSHTEL